MIIVADASPLVALALCDCLAALTALFDDVAVSQAVYEEVTVANKPGADKLRAFLQGKVHTLDLDKFIIGGDVLDEGELTSIALYKHLQADFLLIDEKSGRRIAKLNHIQIIGSLGVLIKARKKGIIPTLKPHIETLRQARIYFSDTLLDYALNAVGE
ncbi:MAG: DUF3368 domain-containing protein [Gammaproteobacteria bacterium]|nr:DUF3368 domain-containing protein [Gammaproteobacteria bacterium]